MYVEQKSIHSTNFRKERNFHYVMAVGCQPRICFRFSTIRNICFSLSRTSNLYTESGFRRLERNYIMSVFVIIYYNINS